MSLVGPIRLDLPAGWDHRSSLELQNINGYYLIMVQSTKPAYQRTFAEVQASIAAELPKIMAKQAIVDFIGAWRVKWTKRTDCTPGYIVRKCSQYTPHPGEPPENPETLN